MIQIKENDTIIDIVNKIKNCEEKEIILKFPWWHPVLNNYILLKILKAKAWQKRIVIITNDIFSKKIWTPLWIDYSIINDEEFLKETNYKQKLLKQNFTFFEYLFFEIKKYKEKLIYFLRKKTWIKTLKYSHPYNTFKFSSFFILIFWLFVSIWTLIFIFYFAVSKTFIEITPEVNIKNQAINIFFEEDKINETIRKENHVEIKKIKEKITLNYTSKTTWINYEKTQRATWEVIFINEMKNEQVFRPKTRVLTKDGILFETLDWVKIPKRTLNWSWEVIFWKTKAKVIAKIYDTSWNFIWSRWNINTPQILTIPWLKFNQDKIYAKIITPFSWWKDDIKYKVWENDIENAKKTLEDMLKKEALKKIKEKIKNENNLKWTNYDILPIEGIIKYKNININTIWDIKIDDEIDSFELTWSLEIETYVYNKNQVINILKNVINDNLLIWTDKLIFIDENSLRANTILEKEEAPLKIKATVEIDFWISFDFDNNSHPYTQRIKQKIAWLTNDEAKNILINDEKINNVIIKNTPFFFKKVSSNKDNIIIRIKN